MMGFNLQLGDALRSESVTAIDDAIRAIARQEIDRTPRTKFCDACAYMHQPEISARCCCVACHGDDVPAWAQRMNTPPSSEKTGSGNLDSPAVHATNEGKTAEPLPASPVKPCPFGPVEASVERFLRAIEARLDVDDDDAHILSRDGLELLKIAWSNRRTPAPSPAYTEPTAKECLAVYAEALTKADVPGSIPSERHRAGIEAVLAFCLNRAPDAEYLKSYADAVLKAHPAPSPVKPCEYDEWIDPIDGRTYELLGGNLWVKVADDPLPKGERHMVSPRDAASIVARRPNRRTPAPSPATGESALDLCVEAVETGRSPVKCVSVARSARAELASIRAEVERLRTALAEKENGDSLRDVAEDVLSWLDECKLDGEDGQLRERMRTALAEKEKAGVDVAVRDVLAERAKQRAKWTEAHDDGHGDASLAAAAAVLAHPESEGLFGPEWSFDLREKRQHERERCVVAAALLLAEIERLDRRTALGAKGTK